jgi:hypothetical protein
VIPWLFEDSWWILNTAGVSLANLQRHLEHPLSFCHTFYLPNCPRDFELHNEFHFFSPLAALPNLENPRNSFHLYALVQSVPEFNLGWGLSLSLQHRKKFDSIHEMFYDLDDRSNYSTCYLRHRRWRNTNWFIRRTCLRTENLRWLKIICLIRLKFIIQFVCTFFVVNSHEIVSSRIIISIIKKIEISCFEPRACEIIVIRETVSLFDYNDFICWYESL